MAIYTRNEVSGQVNANIRHDIKNKEEAKTLVIKVPSLSNNNPFGKVENPSNMDATI